MTNFICTNCGNTHNNWPALAFRSPDYYATLPKKEQNSIHEASYFGWLSNTIRAYDSTLNIPMTITTQGDQRPCAIPHQGFEHPFVHDFYQGINTLEAQRRVDRMLLNSNNTP